MRPKDYKARRIVCILAIGAWVVLLGMALFLPHKADAASVTVGWDNATLNEDGSTIPATGDLSLASTTLEYAACIAGALSEPRIPTIVPMPAIELTVDIMTPGDWCFVAHHTTVGGTDSGESNIVVKNVPVPIPMPPANLTVIDLVAYTIVKQPDRFLLVAVGTVPADTACNPNQSTNGHYVVPNDTVIWTDPNGPRPVVVVAKCG